MPHTDAVIFIGPSISCQQARAICPEAVYLPPVAQGDLYKVCQEYKPRVIGIIDGYFEVLPAVWHKEILYALASNIHVVGASSMGALRASELFTYGMCGIGEVYEAYKSGLIEDDDEVAIVHAPAPLQFIPLSEAMVNIRKTVSVAAHKKILPSGLAEYVIDIAKKMHYKQRSYARMEEVAGRMHESLNTFFTWTKHNACNVKHDDAVKMLSYVNRYLAGQQEAPQVPFHFESTAYWRQCVVGAV